MKENMNDIDAQYVLFTLADETYGVTIKHVQNIERVATITRVPHSPNYVDGVMNVRGEIIPILNMRTFLGIEKVKITDDSRVIIIRYDDMLVGWLVDTSAEVLNLPGELETVPQIQDSVAEHSIKGLGKVGERLIIVMDLDEIVKTLSKQNKGQA